MRSYLVYCTEDRTEQLLDSLLSAYAPWYLKDKVSRGETAFRAWSGLTYSKLSNGELQFLMAKILTL
jgi:hypothetical protein